MHASSDSEYKCDSESDSDSDSDYTATKRRKSLASTSAGGVKSKKRTVVEKTKVVGGGGGRTLRLRPFQRTWSEDDEITILQGFIEYAKENGISDIAGFYNSINKSISADITKKRLGDKLNRLKKKFLDYESKCGADNESPTFSKPHDQNVFELSKMIWGNTNTNTNTNTSTPTTTTTTPAAATAPAIIVDEVVIPENLSGGRVLDLEVNVTDDYDPIIRLPRLLEYFLSDHELDLDLFEGSMESLEKSWKKVKSCERQYLVQKSRLNDFVNQLKLEATNPTE